MGYAQCVYIRIRIYTRCASLVDACVCVCMICVRLGLRKCSPAWLVEGSRDVSERRWLRVVNARTCHKRRNTCACARAFAPSVIFINSSSDDPPLGAWDYIGWITFAVGWVLQVAADLQKLRFRSDPANKRRVCTTGVWRLSRHPNYCGEVLIWWGIFIAGIPLYVKDPVGFSTIVSPLFTMGVLLALTGIPQAEGQAAKRWFDGGDMQRQFEDYFASTPPLWLCPPAIYRQLPLALKRVLCFELPMYEYKPSLADDGPPEATRNAKPPITVHQQQ
uniref:Steroid 5-alpha reductase C-terminal domain-containing protein n=1 Tax=Chrysotila carterae TaxID=13221 RepID=A0A7S4EUE5_CHRCT